MKAQGWRKKFKNQKVLERDKTIFKVFSKVQYLTREQLRELGLSDRSFNRYIKTEAIEEKSTIINFERVELYKITDYGKEWLQKEVFQEKMSFYNSRGIEHDMKMAQVCVDLLKNNLIETIDHFKSEYEIQREFKNHLQELRDQGQEERAKELEELRDQGKLSAPDFCVVRNEGVDTFEVITDSGCYTQEHKMAKQAFSNVMNYGTVQYLKI